MKTKNKKKKLYLLRVVGDVEPELLGPYASDGKRLARARRIRRVDGDEDGLFRLDVYGRAEVGCFGAMELDDAPWELDDEAEAGEK